MPGVQSQIVVANAPKIAIIRDGQHCLIDPAVPSLQKFFYSSKHRAIDDSRHGYRVKRVIYPLAANVEDEAGDGISKCRAGLEPLLAQQLRRLGCLIGLGGDRLNKLPLSQRLPWELQWDLGLSPDEALLRLVEQHDRGLIRYGRQVEPGRLIAQVATAWPKLSVVIAVTRIDEAWQLRKLLAEYIPSYEITVFTTKTCPAKATRVAIGTYGQLGVGSVCLHRRDILFALRPTEFFENQSCPDIISNAWSARCFALLPSNYRLRPFHRDQVLSLFGCQEICIPRHGKIERPVDVIFSPIYGGPKLPEELELVEIKRSGIWEHRMRNRRIIKLAKLLAACDWPNIQSVFPELTPFRASLRRCRIGVLVENIEHGLELTAKLEDWPLIAGSDFDETGLTAEQRTRLQRDRSITNRQDRHLVVTAAGLQDAGRLDVVIRADAGLSHPALKFAVSTHVNGELSRRTLLIDLDDRHHPVLTRRTAQRQKSYLEAGWNVPQLHPSELDRFLALRPKVDMI